MVLNQSEVLEVRQSPGKGRGVFAKIDIAKGETFERVPVLVFETSDLETSDLMDYAFIWGKKTIAIALGYGSLYNHSFTPNARYYDGPGRTKVFMAIKNIKAGDEILINYNGDPKSREKVEFDVIEHGNGHVEGVNGKAVPAANGKPAAESNGKPEAENGKAAAPAKSRAKVVRKRKSPVATT